MCKTDERRELAEKASTVRRVRGPEYISNVQGNPAHVALLATALKFNFQTHKPKGRFHSHNSYSRFVS